ncbi:TPA: GGDEF domain-containing protein [Legionella pneumophila]|uniref:GGDEF domain-containing protein n=2 Tax=Gammaproteobacteria TaxID=1236 RepID=UPI00048854E1|nr:GGDEF domain-containing protein [Legionella pneumophila]APF04711.1 diguanylate cyclase [Legionella pneumophila subsp. fraseri]APF07703.1 GGDEF domain-containing protein [Legionella pneumophila subsp. fraseri]AUB70147.1 GGDEF domain-containing protein [Legionella pneumophila]AUB73125.1 GGDEF domain-containing protein [Legionella pneumophila]KXB27238.1 diguanylate cyclase [Legionella pneumophila]
MHQQKRSSLELEAFLSLLESSLRTIPFNILAVIVLALDFIYTNEAPIKLVVIWFFLILILSVIRWMASKIIISKERYITKGKQSLIGFLLLNFFMGLAWGLSYLIFAPYLNNTNELIFVLMLGGLSTGAIASLSIYLPAYYAYVLPMNFPIIAYNLYLFQYDKAILAVMYSLFLIIVLLTAGLNSKLLSKVRTLSITDSLTGLFNRRHFDMVFSNELSRAKRNKYPISLIFIDIDNFKYINDTFGHSVGDSFLIHVANILKQTLRRSGDSMFRIGGDEYAAILINMPPNEVTAFCITIQKRFNQKNQYKNVSLSMGVISIDSLHMIDQQSAITAADKTLYQAKKAGKNQIKSESLG